MEYPQYLHTGIERPCSTCCHAQYTIEAWKESLSRRCKKCNKRCQIMSSDDIEEEEEIELPVIEKGIPIEVTI